MKKMFNLNLKREKKMRRKDLLPAVCDKSDCYRICYKKVGIAEYGLLNKFCLGHDTIYQAHSKFLSSEMFRSDLTEAIKNKLYSINIGEIWLTNNPNPDKESECFMCNAKAIACEDDIFVCREHWLLEEDV